MNPKPVIDFRGLAALVRGHRTSRNLDLRAAAAECGVSSSTLSRIERAEARPDLDTVQALVAWIGVPLERVVAQGASVNRSPRAAAKKAEAIDSVEMQFRADPNLAPEAAEALIKIMREAYSAMRLKDKGR
jgi:transcriptional regulator with XRE-family HTH domain